MSLASFHTNSYGIFRGSLRFLRRALRITLFMLAAMRSPFRSGTIQTQNLVETRIINRRKNVRKPRLWTRQVSESAKPDTELPKPPETAWTQIAAFGRVSQPGTRSALPANTPDSVRPSRGAVPPPAVDVTARHVAVEQSLHQAKLHLDFASPASINRRINSACLIPLFFDSLASSLTCWSDSHIVVRFMCRSMLNSHT